LKRVRGEGFNGGWRGLGEKVSMEVEEGQGRRFYWRLKRVRGEGFNGGWRGSGEKVSMKVE